MQNNKKIFKRMRELDKYNSRIDMHMHTDWTDGNNTLLQMIDRADTNGMGEIAITDHIRRESDYFFDYLNEISAVIPKYKMRIYSGFEAKILDTCGNVDISQEVVDKADVIIGSVHRIPYKEGYTLPKEIPYEQLTQIELELTLSAIKKSTKINVIGHSGGMSISAYGSFPENFFDNIIYECAKNDIAFEFNYKYHQIYESELKELLFRYNPYVSVGSDAHCVDAVSSRSFYYDET